MKDRITRLNTISKKFLLKDSFVNNTGLLNGKMGIAIFFFHYARYTGNKDYNEFANELLDEVYDEISLDFACDFSDGLCGIGWGLLYLIQQKFVDADPDEILEEIDCHLLQNSRQILEDSGDIDNINSSGFLNYMANRNLLNRLYQSNSIAGYNTNGCMFHDFKEIAESLMQTTAKTENTGAFLKNSLLLSGDKRCYVPGEAPYNVNIIRGLYLLLTENQYENT